MSEQNSETGATEDIGFDLNDTSKLIVEMSKLLNIDVIDKPSLRLCIKLLDEGIDPQRLAQSIKKMNLEAAQLEK